MGGPDIRHIDHREFAVLSAELIKSTGGLRFRARGGSMAPSIRDGDVLVLEKTRPDGLRIGDVVLVRSSEELVIAHRIISRQDDRWITCGDARSNVDMPFGEEQLLGRVITVERNGVAFSLDTPARRFAGRLRVAIARDPVSLPARALRRLLLMFAAP